MFTGKLLIDWLKLRIGGRGGVGGGERKQIEKIFSFPDLDRMQIKNKQKDIRHFTIS